MTSVRTTQAPHREWISLASVVQKPVGTKINKCMGKKCHQPSIVQMKALSIAWLKVNPGCTISNI